MLSTCCNTKTWDDHCRRARLAHISFFSAQHSFITASVMQDGARDNSHGLVRRLQNDPSSLYISISISLKSFSLSLSLSALTSSSSSPNIQSLFRNSLIVSFFLYLFFGQNHADNVRNCVNVKHTLRKHIHARSIVDHY